MTVHEAVERKFAKWAYLRIVPISGGVRVGPIHTRPKCSYMKRCDSGEDVETVRVLLSTLEDHAILGALRLCRRCERDGPCGELAESRIAARHERQMATGANV